MTDLKLFDLSGKKAMVTGSAMGIGRACVIALGSAGAYDASKAGVVYLTQTLAAR